MIRMLVTLFIVGALAFCGATVPLGKRTFFGHVKAIWSSDQMSDLKDGVKEKAGPAMKKAECKVKKGIEGECEDPVEGSGSGSAAKLPKKPAHVTP